MTVNKPELIKAKILEPSDALPLILLTIALLALSLTAIFIKFSISQISANATLFNRLWIATIIFGLWSGVRQSRQRLSVTPVELPDIAKSREILFLVILATIHVLGRFFWTWSLTQTSAANATVLANSTPLFSTLGAWLFFQQRFNSKFLIGMAFAIVVAIALAGEDLSASTNSFIGDAAALTSALFYAASFLILEHLRTKLSVTAILVWRCLIGTLLMLPVVLIFEDQILPISWSGWLAVIGLAAICEVVGHGLVVYSLKQFSAAFVTVFLLLEPVISAILAWIIFSESLSILNLFGFGLIMEGIYLAKNGESAEKTASDSTRDESERLEA